MSGQSTELEEQLSIQKAWQTHTEDGKDVIRRLQGCMAWIWDWFREELPLEDPAGSSLYHLYRQVSSTGLQNLREVYQPKPAENILVFPDSYGFCNGILNNAPEGRVGKQLIVSKTPEALTQNEVKDYLKEEKWDLLIFGYSIDTPDENTVEAILAKQDAVTRALFWVSQELAKNPNGAKRMAVLTADNFTEDPDIHQECGVSITTNATVYGMINSIRQELNMPIQYIDVEWSLLDERFPYLATDIFRTETFGRKPLRILNKGRYWGGFLPSIDYSIQEQDFPGKFKLPEEGIIAITGGNGALGLVMGTWFLKQAEKAKAAGRPVKFSIQFLSRSMKVSEGNKANWMVIQDLADKLGIVVEHAKMDAGDRSSVVSYLEGVSPNLAGIVHSAGILKDGMLVNQTWQNFSDIFDAKNRGALYIHDALETLAPKNPFFSFYWLFSSMAVYGNMGQVPYSGSNSYNDCLSRHRRALGKPCTVMQWGAWGEVGMATTLDANTQARFRKSPTPPFSTQDGLKGMEQGLAAGVAYYAVQEVNTSMMLDGLRDDSHLGAQGGQFQWQKVAALAPPTAKIDEKNIYKYLCWLGANLNPQGEEDPLVYKAFVKQTMENY
mmetsp:Transcript_13391/g.31430  ORF Transcript_13391/g.31430 Transcript_13391/m.31430 type:complete len:609 (-) Transcript_13391:81-1907(-)